MFQWVRALKQTTTYLGVIMIAVIWGGVFWLANAEHERAVEDGLRQGGNLARVFEEYISRVSAVQFRRGESVNIVTSALLDSGLPPERLELEITESVLMHGTAENVGILHRLQALGISIVLDDFGTGYSSLSYLRLFPFDRIKIDRSFVAELSSNADCAAIVAAVAGLGKSLAIDTVAEGVETAEQLTLVHAAGCTCAQGYLFGRPCRASELDFGPLGEPKRNSAAA